MEVHFGPDVQATLTPRATQEGRNLDQVVQDVFARYFSRVQPSQMILATKEAVQRGAVSESAA